MLVKKILLVEDDDNQRLLFKEELEAEGYLVVEAQSGKEALEKVRSEKPDLVVLDIAMPGMNGVEALTRIHDIDRKVPVIFHTAYASYKDQFVTWLAEEYVVKSSNLSELKQKVRAVLQQSDAGGR